jgi:hypothetical protein
MRPCFDPSPETLAAYWEAIGGILSIVKDDCSFRLAPDFRATGLSGRVFVDWDDDESERVEPGDWDPALVDRWIVAATGAAGWLAEGLASTLGDCEELRAEVAGLAAENRELRRRLAEATGEVYREN